MRPWPATAALACGLVAASAGAATLDVAPQGDDLVFTWDGGTDDLLRGTTADNLQPWMPGVSPPLVVPLENVMRGENAFYKLASGSNMAWRIEFEVPPIWMPGAAAFVSVTLPERSPWATAFDVLRDVPTMTEIVWWDPVQQRHEAAVRVGGVVSGDDEPLPRHGGVMLHVSAPTTLVIVGSHDPTYAGWDEADVGLYGQAVLGIPPHIQRPSVFEAFCGQEGIDWVDGDGNGLPDTCGTDLDFDGKPDTGIWHGEGFAELVIVRNEGGVVVFTNATYRIVFGREAFAGLPYSVEPGMGWFATLRASAGERFNLPYRPDTW